jgi:hypothetical protein
MLSNILAFLERGLRVDARLVRLHVLRLGMVLLVFGALFIAHLGSVTVGAPGLGFFAWICWTTLIFSTLAGSTFFATCITEEKEEQTLGLLTLANIRPAALIVGKFLPRLCNALLILTVLFPFTLLSITLGGVTWEQVWAAYWLLFAHVVVMGSIGLFFSIISRNSGWAIAWTLLGQLLFFAGPPIVAAVLGPLVSSGSVITGISWLDGGLQWLSRISLSAVDSLAFVRINQILSTGFDESAFSLQVLSNLGLSASLFIAGWLLFPLFNRSAESTTEQITVWQRGVRLQRGSRRSWKWAIAWKDFYYVAGGPTWWGARAICFLPLAVIAGLAANNFNWDSQLRHRLGETLMLIVLFGAIPIELTLLAARLFRAEIKDGTWANLAGLPLSMAHIAYAKVIGSLLGLAPAVALLLAGALLSPESIRNVLFSARGEGFMFVAVYGYYFAVFLIFLHLTALYSILINAWAGVLLGLLTMWVGSCFIMPILMLPAMLIGALSSWVGTEFLGALIGMGIYGIGILAICFGLQVLIAQQLRVAGGK